MMAIMLVTALVILRCPAQLRSSISSLQSDLLHWFPITDVKLEFTVAGETAEVRHPPNSFGNLRGMPGVVTRAHAAGAGTIRVLQAAADMNSSSVLLGFSFEREHRPDWRMAFGKRPFPCEIGPNAQDEMDMVAHDGIAADIDREDRSELLEPLADPLLVVLVIMPGFDVEPTKERPANASRDAMIDPNLVGRHDLRARVSWHRDVTPLAETRSGGR